MTMMTPLELRNAWVTPWTVFTQPTPQCIHYTENNDDIDEDDDDNDNLDENYNDHDQDSYHYKDDTHQMIGVILGLIFQFWVTIGHLGNSVPFWTTLGHWVHLSHFGSIWDSLAIWIF